MGRDGTTWPGLAVTDKATSQSVRPELQGPDARPSISGSYSVAEVGKTSVPPPSEGERVSWTQPVTTRRNFGFAELQEMKLAAMAVTADRRLVSGNHSAHRLLELHLGFELDGGYVRCTEPRFAPKFAKLVSEATAAAQRGREFHGSFELRQANSEGWLDVVVATHPEQSSPHALVIARART